MEREILAYIKQNRMIGKNDVVLAGVSGGSDSMAMLRILKELQGKLDFTLRVVHIHHGIRGKEADRDQSFVENICRKWQIPCTVYCYDVPGLSREWKLGEEETGRIVRKEAFQREAAVCGRKDSEIKIALAHNQEDLAETMLHNLCRGTGLRGLCTMRPVDGEIIRPAVKVVEAGAPPVKDGRLIFGLCELVVDVLVFNGFGVIAVRYPAHSVPVHFPVREGLLGGGGNVLSFREQAGKALLFRLSACGLSGPSAVSQSAAPPFWR